MRVLVFFILINYIFALAPVCREGGRLRSDLQFKYTYTDSISDSSKDVDFSQRSGEYVKCNAAGDSVTDGTITKSISCESVARSEGPGMDRFGWAKQIAVSVKGSVKIYSGDLNDASPTEFTSGDECGSTIEMALGSQYMAAVCKKAVRIYRFDGTTWTDHEEIAYPNAVDHELQVSLNHEDYLIVSEPSTTTVKVYKLGAIKLEVQSMTGDGAVAAAVNCMGSVFAYESSGAVKIKQLSQKDGSWSDLTDIAVDPVSLSMSTDVLAVGLVDNTNVYMFANSGTEYAEYKSLKGGDSFGKVISIEHEDLAIVDDNRLYLFKEGTATKCRAGQKLEDGVCVDCGPGHTNAHDNTDSVCNVLQCTSSQFSLAGTCSECPAGATGVAGPASVDSDCTCAAGKTFDAPTGLCNPVLCAENEHVVSNVCTACAAGTTNVADNDSSGADTQCTATLCAVDEQVVGNSCVACPAGSSNAKDDDASGADTTCDPTTTCAVDEFYTVAGGCEACPAGTNKAVAVDSVGGDSTCDAILCAENEHVASNVCTPCSAGSEIAAGSDATGADTFCTCPADSRVAISYASDNTKKYEGTACTDNSDCETKCTGDSACLGYTEGAPAMVKAWGDIPTGVFDNVVNLFSNDKAYAALKADGSVQVWGEAGKGGTDPGITSGVLTIARHKKQYAFATLKLDGSVQAWGTDARGGCNNAAGGTDTNCVPDGLTDVASITSGAEVFAALKSDGSVTVWGHQNNGGCTNGANLAGHDYKCVPYGLSDVTKIYSTWYAFAALKSDGSVKNWGSNYGGCTTASHPNADTATLTCKPTDLSGVVSIASTQSAFAALKDDGSVVSWGNAYGGTDVPSIGAGTNCQYSNGEYNVVGEYGGEYDYKYVSGTGCVTKIVSNDYAFAVLKSDGSVKSWGSDDYGGTDPGLTSGVTKLIGTNFAFAALKDDGSVKAWGLDNGAGTSSGVDPGITSDVVDIFSTVNAFAALKSDGSVQVWGWDGSGGTDPGIGAGSGIVQIYSHRYAFAALKSDGSVQVWGHSDRGGTDPSIAAGSGITNILSNDRAFLALGAAAGEYGPEVTGSSSGSVTKNNGCSTCGTNEERPAGDLTNGPETQCSCAAGTEGDGSACQACPANSNAIVGPISSQCVKNEGAVWKDVEPDPVNHGNCDDALDCTTKAADPSTCTQPYEDGGNLQATSPCCKILEPLKCGCDEDFRVANNVCIACTGGETRPAGDDPDGANTYCSTEGIGLAFGNNGDTDYTHGTQNDPDINLKVGQKYSFLRDTAGHPLRIVSAEDCDGKGCDTGTYTTLPTSSVSDVDAVQSSANIVWTPKKAGTYYYLCTSHPNMVGKLIVAWDVCAFGKTTGAVTLTSSCLIDSTITLTGAMSISAASARRLRSTGDKPLISFSGSVGVDAGVYALQMTGVEVTDVKSDGQLATSTTGTIQLTNVDLKDNPRNTGTGSLFKTAGGHIVGQNMVISNSKGKTFEGESGGDISLANAVVTDSGTLITQIGGAVVVRDVNATNGGKFADMDDATSIFEAVVLDATEGIKAVNSGVQIERSEIKNQAGKYVVDFDASSCTKCERQFIVEDSVIKDNNGGGVAAISVKVHSTTSNRPKVKFKGVEFSNNHRDGAGTLLRDLYSDNDHDYYVVDAIGDPVRVGNANPSLNEECYTNQCSHKPLATSCKVDAGHGTKCICDVGVATYKASTKELEKQTTVEEILSILFATAETADRIVKMVDDDSRYVPTQPTAEASKSNILLMKPTNQDGNFMSEKTILLKPDSGTVCATFQTWLCAELTACHSSDGTFTAECDGITINMPARHRLFQTNKFKRLRATHPEDSNCQGAISNLKQSCTDGAGATYERCVQYAYLLHDNCICIDGMKSNSAGDACLMEDNLCKINERVQGGRCVPCEDDKTNKAGDDMTAGNSQCDDVICKELYRSDGSGNCIPCAAGEFNLGGDIAATSGGGNGEATTCCASGEYEYDVSIDAGGNIDSTSNFARTCKACADATDPIRNRFGTTGGGLSCCRGDRLGLENGVKCGRIMDYYKKVCQPLESATTCPAQSYA